MRCLLCHRLAQSQLTAVADGIQALSQLKTVAKWLPATRSAARQFSAKGDADAPPQRLVTALLKSALSSLSIPHAELDQLAGSQLSDAALTAWALTKTAAHPAVEEAAGVSRRLMQLLKQLDGAMLWQQQADASPIGQLLWHVAISVSGREVRGLNLQDAQVQLVECQASLDMAREAGVDAVLQQLHQLTKAWSITAAVKHPAFWDLAHAAIAHQQSLLQDLQLLGYDLVAAGSCGSSQLQQLQQLLGVQAATLHQQLVQELQADLGVLSPGCEQQLHDAVAHSSQAHRWLAQLQLLQSLAQALGFSGVQVVGSPSAPELVARLTGASITHQAVDDELLQQLSAAAPQLLAAVTQVPCSALDKPSVGRLLQLLESKPDLQVVAKSLTAWRAAAAAAGHVPVLTTLSQAEVAGLSKEQASAMCHAILQLEAQARLLMRKAAARQLTFSTLSDADAAALAWRLHTGPHAAVEAFIKLVFAQAADTHAAAVGELDSAAAALKDMAAAFHLEELTSRRSSAAPPSQLVLAGLPQHQVTELTKSFPALEISSSSSSVTAGSTLEGLVRALADLLAGPGTHSASQQSAAQRLQVIAHDLPKVLSGALLDLLAVHNTIDTTGADSVRQHQQRLRAFLSVLEVELPRLAAADGAHVAGSQSGAASDESNVSAGEGLLELLGQQDSKELLLHSSHLADGAGEQQQQGLYEQLGDIHHDVDIQRYLQMEFDPALDIDLVHAPRGWRDTELWLGPAEFLEAMRPLLDKYLEGQQEAALTDMEWQVYRDAALAEHEQSEVYAAAGRSAAGHSPFNNSKADEAYLTQRLETGIPQGSVLYAAAHKYLKASFRNRTWRFAQRKHMVDRLVEIAAHLAAHPPRTHRGSPFSPLFQPDGPPMVPRLARKVAMSRMTRSTDNLKEVSALPDGFCPPAVH